MLSSKIPANFNFIRGSLILVSCIFHFFSGNAQTVIESQYKRDESNFVSFTLLTDTGDTFYADVYSSIVKEVPNRIYLKACERKLRITLNGAIRVETDNPKINVYRIRLNKIKQKHIPKTACQLKLSFGYNQPSGDFELPVSYDSLAFILK